MSIEMKPAKQQVYGLLQFLHDKNSAIQISREHLLALIWHIVYGENGNVSAEQKQHEQLLTELEGSGALVQRDQCDSIDREKIQMDISDEKYTMEPLSEAEVRYQLARVLGYEQCATCKSDDPEIHLVLIYLNLMTKYSQSLLDLIEKFKKQIDPNERELILLDEHTRASNAWIRLAGEKRDMLAS